MQTANEVWQEFIDTELLILTSTDELDGVFAGDARRDVLRQVLVALRTLGIEVDDYGTAFGPLNKWCWEPAHETAAFHGGVPCTICCDHERKLGG